jgi:hypothetical protein
MDLLLGYFRRTEEKSQSCFQMPNSESEGIKYAWVASCTCLLFRKYAHSCPAVLLVAIEAAPMKVVELILL